jgi:hypothetical protein
VTMPDRNPMWWRALAWLPDRLFIDCSVCLFWRGAVIGFGIGCAVALAVLIVVEV